MRIPYEQSGFSESTSVYLRNGSDHKVKNTYSPRTGAVRIGKVHFGLETATIPKRREGKKNGAGQKVCSLACGKHTFAEKGENGDFGEKRAKCTFT